MPELQEIDRLIAGTPPAAAPEAAGPSVQELDRLISAIPSAPAPPRPDLTGATGTGAEGFQIGQVSPEVATTPKVLPGVPSQAEVMATPPGTQEAPASPAPVQIPPVAPVPVAQKTAAAPAPYEGPLPKLPEPLAGPNVPGQAVATGLQAGVQSVAEGAKNITEGLTGFLTTARQQPDETFAGHKVRAARQIMDGLFNLGLAPFLAAGTSARELLREVNPAFESREIIDPITSGAIREGLLGAAPPERTAESLAAVQKPMTVGEVVELALTLGIPAMVHGRMPKATEAKPAIPKEVAPKAAEVPAAPQAVPDAAAVLRRAEEASQRAEAALRKIEELSKAPPVPPPLEVPPEATPTPEVPKAEITKFDEEARRAQIIQDAKERLAKALEIVDRKRGREAAREAAEGFLGRPLEPPASPESKQLPAGRIAEAAPPPEVKPAEVPPPKAEVPPPEDEMAALRRELNPEVAPPPEGQPRQAETPAFRQPASLPTQLFVTYQGRRYPVESFEDASRKFRQTIQAANVGASQTPHLPIVDTSGQTIAYVSYNGRVWAGRPGTWKPGQKPLYDPFGEVSRPALPETPAFREALREPAPMFFSQLQREIDRRLPQRATPEQIKNIVASGAVKADEVKWSGLEDYLAQLPAGQMVDKAALQTFLRENEVRVEEVQKGQEKNPTWTKHGNVEASSDGYKIEQLPNGYFRASAPGGLHDLSDSFEMALQQVQEWRTASGRNREPTKFDRFALPGGEQYRELLLTLPGRRETMRYPEPLTVLPEGYDPIHDSNARPDRQWGVTPPGQMHGRFWAGAHPTRAAALEAALRQLNERRNEMAANEWRARNEGSTYRSPHWEEPNVLAHVRFDDRTDAQGARVLFIEELQSDWHQEGRRKGYQGKPQYPRGWGAVGEPTATGAVPPAPFAKTWHELVLKRMLRWAAEHGYDKLAFTTGEQQAERYDLSKQVKAVEWSPKFESVRVEMPNGAYQFIQEKGVKAEDLERYVGKDAAKKLLEQEPSEIGRTWRRIEGADLKVGGEGMKAFYDQMLPQFLNKYGKKWGARVGGADLQRPGPSPIGGPFEPIRVPAIDITPEMRRSVVQEGQPMFMARQQPGESQAAWGQRWLGIFKPSLADRVEIGSGLTLTDTWMERPGDQLRTFAADARYLIPISREAKGLFGEIHEAIHRDQRAFGGVDLLAFDTGFGETASLVPGTSLGKSRPQMVLNPYAILEEAKQIAASENTPVLPVFGRVLRESILHEFAHALTESPAHDAMFDGTLSDLRERYGAHGQKEISRLADVLRGYHYDRFANDSDEFRISAVERGGAPPGQGYSPEPPPGAIFAQHEPPGPSGVARPIPPEGTRPQSGLGGGSRPGANLQAGTTPGIFPRRGGSVGGATPELGGTPGPARREGQLPEPRPDLTDRVAEAGRKFPAEDFARWADSMRGALGPGVEPYLQPAWDKIRGVEATVKGEAPPPAEPPKSPFQAPPQPPEAETPPPEGPPPLQEPILTLGRHKEVVDAAGEMFQRAGIERDKDRWPVLSDQILDAMREGTLDLPVMREVLQAHGLSLVEFGEQMFRPAVKNAAQRLQMLSVLQRRLNRLAVEAGKGTEADALLNLAQQVETLRREGGDEAPLRELSWWRRADNVRRGLLVTQVATAVRNLETQLGRLPIDVLDQALQKAFGGKEAAPWAAWESFTDALSQIRPTKGGAAARKASQGQIEALLQAFPREWDRLFGTYSADIARQARERGTALTGADAVLSGAEKVVSTLNFFNRFQEFAVRRAVFWSDLASRLERRGIDAEALAKGERRLTPEEWDAVTPDVKASVQKALEMTFAQNAPYGSAGWHFVQFVNKAPVILTGPLPFPRFMVNSLKFLYDFSPLPFLKLLSSAERAKIAAGDTKLLSRASLGTAAFLGAWLVREGQPDENKWYEMTVPGAGTTDIRPFNPFAAYFFLGDLAKRARTNTLYRTDWKDIVRGVASANVSGGLGLFALDKIIAGLGELGKPGKTMEAISQAGGEVLSGLLVPLRTLTDLYAQFDPEWQVVRERRGEPFLGPAKGQFGIGEPQYLPTRAEPLKREQPALRQATGITKVSEKNDLEKELDRFQFSRQEIQGPSTGDPVADNMIAKHMGQLAETQTLPKLAGFPYQGLSDPQRMEWLRRELTRIRAIARGQAKREDRELFKEVEAGRVPSRRRLLNEERQGQGLAPLRRR